MFFPPPSPHWGEGGGEGGKTVRRKSSDLFRKDLIYFLRILKNMNIDRKAGEWDTK
jgi:hypothetical protein